MASLDLPSFAVPGSMTWAFEDAGFTQSGAQFDDYVPRKGGRFRARFTFGPYVPEDGRIMVARLVGGKQSGLKVKVPLLHDQGLPGNPRVNFSINAPGRTMDLENFTPGYEVKEGFFLSFVVDGVNYLHTIATGGIVPGNGQLTIELNELLRTQVPDNTLVNFVDPEIEGLVIGDEVAWSVSVNRLFPIEFTIKERA
ncbi:MAG: hypothetical protein AAGB23_05210 [Pseudomonadota bacterium]